MLQQEIETNKRKTYIIVFFYCLIFIILGAAVGFQIVRNVFVGVFLAIVIGAIYAIFTLSQANKMILKRNFAYVVEDKNEFPVLWNVVEDMAMVSQVPMPKIGIMYDDALNAFATGLDPNRSVVAVTTGLLEQLNREELEGVIAHELSHIRNHDVRLQTIVIALSSAASLLVEIGIRLSNFGLTNSKSRSSKEKSEGDNIFLFLSLLVIFISPILLSIIRLTLSRNREYLADSSAVELTRNPQGLISALRKIAKKSKMERVDLQSSSTFFANPRKKYRDSWFSTHPSIENRIARLENC